MNRTAAILFLGIFTLTLPLPAQAYLVPLIGVGGVLLTMLTGVFAAVCAGIFLIIYNIRRVVLRKRGKDVQANTSDDPLEH